MEQDINGLNKMKSLLHKSMMQFMVCTIVILILAAPLFYWLTKNFYAEDMIDIIGAVQHNEPIPELDLEEDIMQGVMIQYLLISGVLGIAIILVNSMMAKRLWKPFDETLRQAEDFRVENGVFPPLPESRIKEFTRLNLALNELMKNSLESYQTQKEFTENASHELQTPLAVFQSKLDLLLQQPDLTQQQADIIQGLYDVSNRLSRLNKNLLLLAKIDNKQYNQLATIELIATLKEVLPFLENLTGNLTLHKEFDCTELKLRGNQSLLESLINNLVINAVRHNIPQGEIRITVTNRQFTISNTSSEGALDKHLLFNRFYRPSEKAKGNGLGLSIAKAICDYHGWEIDYTYREGMHVFSVEFKQSPNP